MSKILNVNENNLKTFAGLVKNTIATEIDTVKQSIAELDCETVQGEGFIKSVSQIDGKLQATTSNSAGTLNVTTLKLENYQSAYKAENITLNNQGTITMSAPLAVSGSITTTNNNPTGTQVVNKTHLTSVIDDLNSQTAAVASGYVLSGVTIKNGLISSRAQTNQIQYANSFSSGKIVALSGAVSGYALGGHDGGWDISTLDKSNYLIGALTSLLIGGTAQTVNPSSAEVTKTLTYDFSDKKQSKDVEFICCFSPSFGYTYWRDGHRPSRIQLLINDTIRHTLSFEYGGMVYIRYTRGNYFDGSKLDRIRIWTLGDGSNKIFQGANSSDPALAYDEVGKAKSTNVKIIFTTGEGCYSKYTTREHEYTE